MEYAQLNKDGKDATQITSHGLIEWDANNFCTAEALVKDGKAGQFRVVELIATDPPIFDPLTQSCIRDGCEKVKGKWQYKWRIDNLSPEQIAANTEAALLTKRSALVCSPRQIRQALTATGLRESVEAVIASGDQNTKDWYEFATAFERLHPMAITLATALGVSEAQLDALFELAVSL